MPKVFHYTLILHMFVRMYFSKYLSTKQLRSASLRMPIFFYLKFAAGASPRPTIDNIVSFSPEAVFFNA